MIVNKEQNQLFSNRRSPFAKFYRNGKQTDEQINNSVSLNNELLRFYCCCVTDVSHFQKLKEETSNDFDIHWNSEPVHIGIELNQRCTTTY